MIHAITNILRPWLRKRDGSENRTSKTFESACNGEINKKSITKDDGPRKLITSKAMAQMMKIFETKNAAASGGINKAFKMVKS